MSRLLTTGVIGVIGGSKTFEFTINTGNTSTGSTTSTQFKLPLVSNGVYDMTVDWGDGSSDKITAYNQLETTHEYGVEGIYTISISGTLKNWSFNNTGDRLKITDISKWAIFTQENTSNAFRGCTRLNLTATDAPTLIGSMTGFFQSCSSLDADIGHWDMSQVTSLSLFFTACTIFNNGGSASINDWDVSNVTNFNSVFYQCTVFNQPLNNWDVSSSTRFTYTFFQASYFNQDISSWNVSNATSFVGTFQNAIRFNNAGNPGINNWNLSSATTLGLMFAGARAFNQPLSNWNLTNVTNIGGMFQGAILFNQDISTWNVSNVTSFHSTFNGATAFNQNINTWDVSNATDMTYVFANTQNYNQPLDNWNVSKVTSFLGMFANAQSFNQNINNWNTIAATTMNIMFQGASVFNQPLNLWNTANVTNMSGMFNGAPVFNQPLDNWDVSKVTNMSIMFRSAVKFNQNIGNWDVTKVTTFNQMFFAATQFNNGGVSSINNWNTANVTDMGGMFYECYAFNQPINNWNVSACINFNQNVNGFLQRAFAYSTTNQDLLYNGWINYELQPNEPIDFTANYTAAAVEGRALLTRPYTTIAVSNVANNGSGLIRVTTSTAHGLTTGNKCFLKDITGTTEANGLATVTVIDATTFDIDGSTFTNAYVSGGTVITGYGWTITDGGLI